MLHETITLAGQSDLVLLIARIIVAATMLHYGWPKLKDLKSNAEDFVAMGFKPGWLFGTGVAFLETFGSLALLLGFYTRITAALFAIHMLTGTVWKITSTDKPFTDWSYDLVIMALALVFVAFGAGSYSLT